MSVDMVVAKNIPSCSHPQNGPHFAGKNALTHKCIVLEGPVRLPIWNSSPKTMY